MNRTRVSGLATVAVLLSQVIVSTSMRAGTPPATTVVTHGFQLSGTVPDWVFALSDAIARRAGIETGSEGRVLVYQGADGSLVDCSHPQCTTSGPGHNVIVFDWADDSNEEGAGFSEAAAEALFAGLVAWNLEDPPLVDLERLHLIGHSRGAVVQSEVAERLIAAGLPAPLQVTSLDPHDAGGGFAEAGVPAGGLDDYDVNQEHPEYDCHDESTTPGVCAWQESGYHDNYWQNDSSCFFLLPRGLELFGASNFNQNDLDSPFCHSDTHAWYFFTVAPPAPVHPVTLDPPGPDWFGVLTECSTSPRTVPLTRAADGYNLSDAASGLAARCPQGPGDRQSVLFDFDLQEGVVNGDFERVRPGEQVQAGWSFHGGLFAASLGFDTDNHLVLDAGDLARHGRIHLPVNTLAIEVCRKVVTASGSDLLSVALLRDGAGPRELLTPSQQSVATLSGWDCFEAPILEQEAGRRIRLEISLTDLEAPTVWIDDVRLVVPIFADGFESGDTTRWSMSVP